MSSILTPTPLIDTPHFDLPFRIVGGTPAVVEQDTAEEIQDCVEAICRFTVGARPELPTFGIPDQTFTAGGADPAPILAAVQQWEPRAAAAAQADNSSLLQYVTTIVLSIESGAA